MNPNTFKYSLMEASIVILVLQYAKTSILENQSITTKTYPFPFLVEGKQDMETKDMDSQGLYGVGRGVYSTFLFMVSLEMVQVVQDLLYLETYC
jgi:hypothetical protein